jgi:uncharacterized repeat protein (TIGR03803 family)
MKLLRQFLVPVLLFTALNLSAQTETILYSFGATPADGANPAAGPVFDASGNLYGSTYYGGTNDTGTIYEVPATGGESVLADCPVNGTTGSLYPNSALIFDEAGNLYGTSAGGGLAYSNYGGTDFEVSRLPNGSFAIKRFSNDLFGGENDLGTPAGLIFDSAGNLWGTALGGFGRASGTVYELVKSAGSWERLERYSFPKSESGQSNPTPGLVFDASGNLYGKTMTGSAGHKGTVYELAAPNYTFSSLLSFNGFDGNEPTAGVILDASGNLYGTTTAGGPLGMGNVFELSPNGNGGWTERVLFNFNGADGQAPGALTFDSFGNLYGTTASGGATSGGVAFKLSPASGLWTETILHNFGSLGDGSTPVGALIFDSLGNLYGATEAGGANGLGTVYEIEP